MSKAQEKRDRTLAALRMMGCGIVLATFDRRSASHAVGMMDGSGYFGPTFSNEDATLNWAVRNLARIERYVVRGEPLELNAFIGHVMTKAYEEAGDDPVAFSKALAPRMTELKADARAMAESDAEMILEDVEEAAREPSDIMRQASELLDFEFDGASPRLS